MNHVIENKAEVKAVVRDAYCVTHGWFKTQTAILLGQAVKTVCPRCIGVGDSIQVSQKDTVAEARELAIKSLIPKRFEHKTLANFKADTPDQKRALAICNAYAVNFHERFRQGGGLVMCGRPGTGKTHLACAIGNHLINELAVQTMFMTVIEAIRKVKDTYGTNDSEQAVLDSFCKPKLLVLDEVGVQFGTNAEKLILFEIINNRYKDMKPTILISNLAHGELGEYIGERVLDRMREGGGAVIGFDWESHRGKAA